MPQLAQFVSDHWLDMFSTGLGLIYLYLEYRAHIALWVVGVVMPAVDIYLYWSVGLYADCGMAAYYTIAAIYGYAAWKFAPKRKNSGGNAIKHFPAEAVLPSAAAFSAAWAAIYWILVEFTDSSVPVTDSFVNALSFVALWALSRKYMEQWLIWMVVDVASAALYAYKGIPFKASLYALYAGIAVIGYLKWKRMAESGAE